MTTVVLGGPAGTSRSRRGLSGLVPVSPSLARALPTTALLVAVGASVAVGLLPLVDGELVVAGLALGFLATALARLVDRTTAAGDDALLVPAAQFAAIALIGSGTGSAAVLF